MQWYQTVFSKFLFLFEAETAHKLSLSLLSILYKLKLLKIFNKVFFSNINPKSDDLSTIKLSSRYDLGDLKFKNRIGIAAGLDKNGDYIAALASLGVGHLELGTVTPRPQSGNPKPRLFRLKKQQAVINRMGFNNKGIDYLLNNINKFKSKNTGSNIILGVNIGKNFDTPLDKALDDYLICFDKAYAIADYITINISSPNTENLRDLQHESNLKNLLFSLKNRQLELNQQYSKYTPIALKIAPDLTESQVETICRICFENNIDIIIATNTTIENKLLYDLSGNKIAGGLSGKPLFDKSNSILSLVNKYTKLNTHNNSITIIGVGGISSQNDANNKISLGADLVQIYTGLVYQGPDLIANSIS